MTAAPTAARRFRDLLAGPDLIEAPGAYDAITARLVEEAGFPLVYMTGAGTALARGYPDYGLLTLNELADNAGVLARAVSVPVLADADTGFGNELNVSRTVEEYEARGVAGLHLEDQVTPKRCGHLDGKEVVDRDHFTSRIAAAVAARSSDDFVIVARTDAAATHGFDEAVARANAALDAGADVAFVEALTTDDQVASVPELVHGPCLLNLVPGGRTPLLAPDRIADLGYRIVIHPVMLLGTTTAAGEAALRELSAEGRHPASSFTSNAEFFVRFGGQRWDDLRRRYDR
ncbi:MAG: isocitrate lyase/PEP mutase family protein [Actinomycetota bacterium]